MQSEFVCRRLLFHAPQSVVTPCVRDEIVPYIYPSSEQRYTTTEFPLPLSVNLIEVYCHTLSIPLLHLILSNYLPMKYSGITFSENNRKRVHKKIWSNIVDVYN